MWASSSLIGAAREVFFEPYPAFENESGELIVVTGDRFIDAVHIPLAVFNVDSGAGPEAAVDKQCREHLTCPSLVPVDKWLYDDAVSMES